ncbi:LacI family DNA-binding transcriptional regulator [Tsukamurella sp. NPDC003166]|uniref:LacI family DNA-binding transcriptional regulator n=1 Tax=Tsukamurella sp. NPDC003166 TaxID=3154444 RepID=UPI0033A28FAA
MSKRPRIADVARRAGVSVTTVSHTFSGNGVVAADTRERVRAAAHELGYRPDVLAQGLRRSRLSVIALVARPLDRIAPDQLHGVDYFLRLAGAAAMAALDAGYCLMLVGDPARDDAPSAALAAEGILLTEPTLDDPLIDLCERIGTPCVTVGLAPRADGTWDDGAPGHVGIETERITADVLEHLAAAGGRAIAFLAADERDEWSLRSVEVYRRWCAARAMPARVLLHADAIGAEAGRDAVDRWFPAGAVPGSDGAPDALFCLAAAPAVGAMERLRELGHAIPGAVRIAAGSDAEEARAADLTAVDLQPEELARRAVTALVGRLRGTDPPALPVGVGRLVVRGSTAC